MNELQNLKTELATRKAYTFEQKVASIKEDHKISVNGKNGVMGFTQVLNRQKDKLAKHPNDENAKLIATSMESIINDLTNFDYTDKEAVEKEFRLYSLVELEMDIANLEDAA